MRTLVVLTLVVLLVLAAASPGLAVMAVIETTAPLQNHSEESIKTAIKTAIETAARGAIAMGLPRIQIRRAFVVDGTVIVHVLASDTGREGGGKVEPEEGAASIRSAELDL